MRGRVLENWRATGRRIALGAVWLAPLGLAVGLELTDREAPRVCATPTPEVVVVEVSGARSELEAPRVVSAPAPAVAPARDDLVTPDPLMFVLDGRVVIDPDADPEWGAARVRADQRTGWGARTVRRAVDKRRAPKDLLALSGEAVTLYGPRGAVCEAELGALSVAARFSGDLNLVYEEEARMERGVAYDQQRGADARLDRRVNEHIYDEGPWSLEAAVTRAGARECEGAIWARLSSDPEPVVFALASSEERGSPLERAELTRAWAAFEQLPEFAAIQREFIAFAREQGATLESARASWTSHVELSRSAQLWRDPSGTRAYVSVLLGEPGVPSCGDFDGTLAALLQLELSSHEPALAPVVVGRDLGARPIAVFDRDHDGVPELVTNSGLAVQRELLEREGEGDEAEYDVVTDIEVSFYGCPC